MDSSSTVVGLQKKRGSEDYCPDRRRKKRSIPAAVIEAYGHLYNHLLGVPAMENFLGFDLDKDVLISLEEAIMTTDNITRFDEFNEVDIDNNGFVCPEEFDSSLKV